MNEQLDIDECIEIAQTGRDGHLTTEQLNCAHCECAVLLERCCICGAEWGDDDDVDD